MSRFTVANACPVVLTNEKSRDRRQTLGILDGETGQQAKTELQTSLFSMTYRVISAFVFKFVFSRMRVR